MKLKRPTHVIESDGTTMRSSRFTEQIPRELEVGVTNIGSKKEYFSIYPLPADAELDDIVKPTEWLQAAGDKNGLTVEIRRRDEDGLHRLYTIGRPAAANEPETTAVVRRSDEFQYQVRPSEVFDAAEAIRLFQHYYDHHTIPEGYHLREQEKFSERPSDDAASQADASPNVAGAAEGTTVGEAGLTTSHTATPDTVSGEKQQEKETGSAD